MMKKIRPKTIFGDSFEMSDISENAFKVLIEFERIIKAHTGDFKQSDKEVKVGGKGFTQVKFYLRRLARRGLDGYCNVKVEGDMETVSMMLFLTGHRVDCLHLKVDLKIPKQLEVTRKKHREMCDLRETQNKRAWNEWNQHMLKASF